MDTNFDDFRECPRCDKPVMGPTALLAHLEFSHSIEDPIGFLLELQAPDTPKRWSLLRRNRRPAPETIEAPSEPEPEPEPGPGSEDDAVADPASPGAAAVQPVVEADAPVEEAPPAASELAPEPLGPEPEPEPVAVEPEPEPEPESESESEPAPVAVEPEPEPVAVEPEPVPEPEPSDVPLEPVGRFSPDVVAGDEPSHVESELEVLFAAAGSAPSSRATATAVAEAPPSVPDPDLEVAPSPRDAWVEELPERVAHRSEQSFWRRNRVAVGVGAAAGLLFAVLAIGSLFGGGGGEVTTLDSDEAVANEQFRKPFARDAGVESCTAGGETNVYEIGVRLSGARNIVLAGESFPGDSGDGDHVIIHEGRPETYLDHVSVQDEQGESHRVEIVPPVYLAPC